MINLKTLLFFLTLGWLGFQCSIKDVVTQKQAEIKKLTVLFCQAEKLKAQRFMLADKLNRVEDSITLLPYRILMQVRRDSILKEAEILTLSTKKLADSIILIQDQLYLDLSPDEKKKVDQAFEIELDRSCN